MRRSVLLVPEGAPLGPVEAFRARHDPLAAYLPAHLTLVFPFRSALAAAEVEAHVGASLVGVPAVECRFGAAVGAPGRYVFLPLLWGNDAVVDLHARLYAGPLAGYRSRTRPFVPHMTVGRGADGAAFRQALDGALELPVPLQALARQVQVWAIGAEGVRRLESTFALPAARGER